MVLLHALGQCLIRTAVTTITPRAEMCFALVSYLTRERGKRVPRRLLEALFWPGIATADASHSLSELVHKLRRKGVLIERDGASCIWLPREVVAVDVDSLSVEPLVSMATRDLSVLPGYSPRASAEFNDWVDEWRGHMQLRVLNDVVGAIARASNSRDWGLTLALADQALRIDEENEPGLLARARAAEQLTRGNRSADNTLDGTASQLRERTATNGWPTRQSRSPATDDTTLVGRGQQMGRLRSQATQALRGAVRSSYISAPAGVGKSRLVRELSAWMHSNGAATCTVSCGRHDGQRPLSAFIQAVPRLQELPGAAGCAPSTLACLARITQIASDEPRMNAHDDSFHLSASIRAAVIDLIDAVAEEQPLLLIVEDVHWIDPASWSLLRTIAATTQHDLFLVCTSRVRWQHAVWGEPDTFVSEELLPLDRADARAHMANCLKKIQRSADDHFIDWCVDTSGGNPYFIEELVNFWNTTGEQYSAPPSLVALTEARLACLKPDTLRVIQAAAILGKNSTIELLQQVLEFPTHVMFSAIEELGEAGLLSTGAARDVTNAAAVLCRHDLVIRAATRALSPQGRALLHCAAARAIELAASGSHSTELLWDCADHWQAAGQPDRSFRAVVACARHLHDMGLVHESVKCCEAALAAPGSDSVRPAVLRVMAQSQYAARDWRAFCATVADVRALEHTSNSAASIHDDLELCELSAQRSLHRDWTSALEMTRRCIHSIDADAPHRVKAAITALKLATNIGDMDAMDSIYQGTRLVVLSADVSVTDRLTLAMIYHTIRGDPTVAANTACQLLRVAQSTLSERYQLDVMLDCASALRRAGPPGEAERICESLFQMAISLRCFGSAGDACHRLIEMYSEVGNMPAAERWLNTYVALHRPKAELRAQRNLCLALARVYLWRRQWGKVANLIESTRAGALWDDPVAMLRCNALATKIRMELGRGTRPQEISDWVSKLAQVSESLRSTGAQDYELYSLYLGFRYMGDTAAAEELLNRYAGQERRDKRPIAPEIAAELIRLNLSL